MSDPFIAEIKIFAGNFAPRSHAFCNGQLLPISQNTALFSLLGTTFGGDGRTTVGLPNLQGRAPMHPGQGPGLTRRRLGERGGTASETLAQNQVGTHTHQLVGFNNSEAVDPSAPRGFGAAPMYRAGTPNASMDGATLGPTGGSQAHNNIQPFLGINFVIALQGVFPPRS